MGFLNFLKIWRQASTAFIPRGSSGLMPFRSGLWGFIVHQMPTSDAVPAHPLTTCPTRHLSQSPGAWGWTKESVSVVPNSHILSENESAWEPAGAPNSPSPTMGKKAMPSPNPKYNRGDGLRGTKSRGLKTKSKPH